MSGEAKAYSFRDHRGNRSVFPSMIVYPNDPLAPLMTSLWYQARAISVATGLEVDRDPVSIDPSDFPHVVTEIRHPGFAHGAATAWVFEGPLIDEIRNTPESTQ